MEDKIGDVSYFIYPHKHKPLLHYLKQVKDGNTSKDRN